MSEPDPKTAHLLVYEQSQIYWQRFVWLSFSMERRLQTGQQEAVFFAL